MSLQNHSLYIPATGQRYALADLGITACTVTLGAVGVGQGDSMSLTLPRDVDADLLFTPFGEVVLLDPTGARRFSGWLMEPPLAASATAESHSYKFAGPGHWLEGITFRQQIIKPTDPTDPASGLGSGYVSRVILNRLHTTSTNLSLQQQTTEIIEYAQANGAQILVDVSGLPDLQPYWDEQEGLSCAAALDSQLRFVPSVTARWDYSSTLPTLRFVPAPVLYNVIMPYLHPVGYGWRSFAWKPRYDLLVGQFRITYFAEGSAIETDGGKVWVALTDDTSTVPNGSTRKLDNCIDLGSGTLPAGLAAAAHAAFSTLTHDIDLQIVAQEPPWQFKVGDRWGVSELTGAVDANGVRVSAVSQQLVFDVRDGTLTAHCGFPSHLGLAELLAMSRKSQRRGAPSDANKYSTGEQGSDSTADSSEEITMRVAVQTISGGVAEFHAATVTTRGSIE